MNKRFGFNLLEVVIAAFLFSTIAVAFLGVWGMQARGLEKSRHTLVATMLAEEMVETAMAKGYEQTPITNVDPEPVVIDMETEFRSSTSDEWSSIPVVYESLTTVKAIGNPDKDKLKMVVVKVTWDDTTKTGEVILVTYLAGVF